MRIFILLLACLTANAQVSINRGSVEVDSVTLREDAATGGLELLVTYPAGHVFAPHWHEANERIILLEGRLQLGQDNDRKYLEPGGYAFLAAREPQRLSCASKTHCVFYVSWDGNPKSHAVPQK